MSKGIQVTEAATVESKEKVSEAPSEVSSEGSKETTYTCSLCGASVVPEEISTPTGIRYKCPECKKFMKRLTPGQVKERKEAATSPLPPPEVLATRRVKELLVKELPRVYGIPKKDATKTITAIIDTLSASAIMDPWNLHSHIKDFAPNANDRHLESIIEKIFDQLREEGYLPRDQEGYQPRYDHQRRTRREYRPGYAPTEKRRERRRYDEEEDYEDELRSRRDAAERRREEEHELKMKRLEAEILKITRETRGSSTPQGSYEEVREFIDDKGNLCDPEKAVSVRIKRVPIGSRGLTAEDIRKIMREDLTPEKVRDIVRSETGKGESGEVKALKAQLNESLKAIEDLRGSIEAKDKQVLLDKIGDLDGRLKDVAATGTGDWKSDEIRLIRGGINDVKDLLKTYLTGERPLARAERILIGPLGQPLGVTPPPSEAGSGSQPGLEELRKRGLVVRLVERAGGPTYPS